ncbi:MAG: TSUP family transporter, partial [Candidatus Nanopelagicales bacterium]
MTIAVLIGVALLAGIFAGLTGAGGGLILVPLLVYLGYSPIEAVATSSIAVMISAIAATAMNSRDHQIPWRR